MFECFNESPVPFRGPEHEGRCLSDVTHTHQNRLMALPLALAVAASTATGLANPRVARADEMSDLQQRIEDSGSAYDEAQQRVDDAQAKIDANEQRIGQIEAELPAAKQSAATSLRAMYKMQQGSNGLINLILSSEDFSEVISNVRYLDTIAEHNNTAINGLVDLSSELSQTRDALASEKAQAVSDAASAKQAMDDAVAARQELEERRAAQAAAEAEAAKQAIEAAKQAAAQQAAAQQEQQKADEKADEKPAAQPTFTTNSGASAEVKVPDNATSTPVQWSEKDSFVNKWQPRIDAYLAGSPLSGHGKTFAEAAWDYGVDPRLSPAISCVESSKGAVCFRPHNAWGWGSSSWPDWDTAIRSHVAGLASGYGGQLSVSTAQKYCPPTWQEWYSSVLSEMNSI